MKKSLKKGFTLVELVIVIAVIAILSAVLIPTFGNVIQNSKDTAAYQNARNALEGYNVDQAQQGNTGNLGEGYIIVFAGAQKYESGANKTATLTLGGSDYVFTYDGQSVAKETGKKILKGGSYNNVAASGLTVTIYTSSDANHSWTASETCNAIPLNYKFTSDGLTATVWWVAKSALTAKSGS